MLSARVISNEKIKQLQIKETDLCYLSFIKENDADSCLNAMQDFKIGSSLDGRAPVNYTISKNHNVIHIQGDIKTAAIIMRGLGYISRSTEALIASSSESKSNKKTENYAIFSVFSHNNQNDSRQQRNNVVSYS